MQKSPHQSSLEVIGNMDSNFSSSSASKAMVWGGVAAAFACSILNGRAVVWSVDLRWRIFEKAQGGVGFGTVVMEAGV